MIDRNEAFKHNSCKKIAQLGKVIFTLTANEIDKTDDKRVIEKQFEKVISDVFSGHYKEAEEIHTNLVRYRKSCIDNSCTEYGNYYKQIKNDFSELIASQTQRLQMIVLELKETKDTLNKIEKANAANVNLTIAAYDEIMNDIKNKSESSSSNQAKALNDAVAPINKKTEALLGEFETNLKAMKAQYTSNSRKLKNEINKLFKDAIVNKKDELNTLHNNAESLKTEIGAIRKTYNNVIFTHQKQSRSVLDARNTLINNTKQVIQNIKKQKENLALQEAKNQKIRQQEIADLTKSLKNARANQKQETDKIEQKIQDKKIQIQKLIEKNNLNMKTRDSALNSITESLKKEHEEEMQKRKADFDQIATEISTIHSENDIFVKWAHKTISQSLEKINNKFVAFKYKIEQNGENSSSLIDADKMNTKKQLDEKLEILQAAIDSQHAQNSNEHESEMKALETIQKSHQEKEEKQQNEYKEKFTKSRKEVEEYRASTKARQDNRVNELEISKSRREKDKQKKVDELIKANKAEIQKKINQKSIEKEEQINKLMKSVNAENNIEEEFKNYANKKKQLESMKQFISKQIEDKKAEIEKASSKFQNDLATIDKTKRQLQRRIETETRAINDEFEMKIQVAQVNLQRAIENISKLFDADENQRGREVIEAIRKVRGMKNKYSDQISKKKKELDELRRNNQDEISVLKSKVETTQITDREYQLKKEIDTHQNKTNNKIKQIQKEKSLQIQAIQETLAKMQSEHEKNKSKIEQQIKSNDDKFEEMYNDICGSLNAAEKFKDEKIEKIQTDFQKKEEELTKKHRIECEKMKKRIEMAKNNLNEIQQQCKEQYTQVVDQWKVKIENQQLSMWKTINHELIESKEVNQKLEGQLTSLLDKQNEIEESITEPVQRNEDKGKIEKLKQQIQSKTNDIKTKFEFIMNLLENGPDQNKIQAVKMQKNALLKSNTRSKSQLLPQASHNQALPPLEGM